jgi:thiol-disulfide isomerase/thioredoxin
MKMKLFKWTGVLSALITGMSLAAVASPSLKVGDSAPKLETGKWVQGDAVKKFQPGKAYIVEFWATWCPPCRASIPHLNEIYNKYKDKGLIVIGQDCAERDESLVAPFVKQMGDKMTYRVALDDKTTDKRGQMAKTWMDAAGRHGIPSAFLVDTKGVIAWIGHPMELKDQVIEEVLAGTYDVRKAAAAYKPEQD